MRSRWWLQLVGLAVLGSTVWHVLTFHPTHDFDPHGLLSIALIGGSGLAILYGAHWRRVHLIDRDRGLRLPAWMFAVSVVFVAVALVSLYAGSRQVTRSELFEAFHVSGGLGLAGGLLVATLEARTMESVETAARAEARAESLQAEQERLERLNDLLRHYILNGVNVITGYADELRYAVPEEDQDAIDAIEESAETMATLVRHVRGLPDLGGNPSVSAVNLDDTIESVLTEMQPRGDLSVDVPAEVPNARASETFGESFYLLLDALRSVTDDGGEIGIRVETDDEEVIVTVVATPADLPHTVEHSLFEPVATDVGLEFYLASALLNHGEIRLAESTEETLRFELLLERKPGDVG